MVTLRNGSAARLANQLSRAARSILQPGTSCPRGTATPVTEPHASRDVSRTEIASTVALVVAASVMLSWVALFNQAPLVFSDTIAYIRRETPDFVSVYYGILILPLHQGITLWPMVFVQGAIMGHLLYLVIRCVSDGIIEKFQTLLIIAGLCCFSSLPWITGEILPDVFAPVVLLGIFLQAFCSNQLTRGERWYIAVLTTVGIAVHLSHIPIAFGLIIFSLALQPMFVPAQIAAHRLVVLVLALFIAVGSMLAVNWFQSRLLSLAKNSSIFLLAKWVDEGPALSYLAQSCPTVKYDLCAYLADMKGLTHDDLKWSEDSPFRRVGSFDQLEPEARRIIWGTLKAYPLEILGRAMEDAGRQLLRFEAGDGLTQEYAKLVAPSLGDVFGPVIETSVLQSKQGQGRLPIAEFRLLHIVGLVLGLGFCSWSVIARRRVLPARLVALQVFVAAGIVLNAIVTGALSGPYDRYLARVIWLICFVGLVSLWYVVQIRGRKQALS